MHRNMSEGQTGVLFALKRNIIKILRYDKSEELIKIF